MNNEQIILGFGIALALLLTMGIPLESAFVLAFFVIMVILGLDGG